MTVLALATAEEAPGWWERVLAEALRPEFAVERYVARPGSVLFGKRECAVAGCPQPTHRSGLFCGGHGRQWQRHGSGVTGEQWAVLASEAGGPAQMRGRAVPVKCGVAECPRSARSPVAHGLCAAHYERWRTRADKGVSLESFIAAAGMAPRSLREVCRVPGCEFPSRGEPGLCDHHQHVFKLRSRARGSEGPQIVLEDFLARVEHAGLPIYSVAGLPSPLRAEMQFALQCRSDDRRVGFYDWAFSTVLRALKTRGVRSLFGLDDADPLLRGPGTGRFLRYARERVQQLADTASGVSEWDRDAWRVATLPGVRFRHAATLSFEFCREEWLREVFKRWARWRLSTGLSVDTVAWNVRTLKLFVEFCNARGAALSEPGAFTRELLEGFAAHLFSLGLHPGSRNRSLGALRTFLDDCRRHEWMPGLDPKATYYRDDYARRPEPLPRYVSDHVMAQLEREENLARLPSITSRTIVEVLIGTGLRAEDTITLEFDALARDTAGAPYLRYFNHKLARERYVPISDRLADRICLQQAWVRETFPAGARCLFPRILANPDGAHPFCETTLRRHLLAWRQECGFREEDGTPVHLTPHRFRHTIATRMINQNIPEIAVQQMLDHSSPAMTRVYAKIHNATLRREFDRYQERIDIRGELIKLDPSGPLSDAAWAKERLARAKLTLPNGYCGRPLQSHCPHPNACLTCPDFLTTVEHLPAHRDQLDKTIELIDNARAAGHERLVEQNEQIKLNLIRIIEGLEALPEPEEQDG
jgi:integrase